MKKDPEKYEGEFDDQVYEDEFYEDNFDEEDLTDDEDFDDEDGEDDYDGKKLHVSYACEDCDYRWDDVVVSSSDFDDVDEREVLCPMCGSLHVEQI